MSEITKQASDHEVVLIAIEVNYIQENTARAERQDMGLDLRELKAHSDTDEKWI